MSTEPKEIENEVLESGSLEALTAARVAVRTPENRVFVEAKINDIYESGNDKENGKLVQPLELIFDGEESITKYVVKGIDAFNLIFGKIDSKGKFEKVKYENDLPISLKVPKVPKNNKGQCWFEIGRKA
jgi:hypothetical protein